MDEDIALPPPPDTYASTQQQSEPDQQHDTAQPESPAFAPDSSPSTPSLTSTSNIETPNRHSLSRPVGIDVTWGTQSAVAHALSMEELVSFT